MSVYVIIKRKFTMNEPQKLAPLLEQLKEKAKEQPGYISTEILQSSENPEDYLVISKWETAESWDVWFTSQERRDIQGRIDSLIGERTFYELFEQFG